MLRQPHVQIGVGRAHWDWRRILLRGCAVPFSLLLFVAASRAGQDQQQPAGYAGSETCATCHEDIAKAFLKNRHSTLDTNKGRGWATRACEGCHGPGAKHAESVSADDIRQPAKLSAKESEKVCLGCHLNQPTHMGRLTSGHARNAVACVACHNVHATGKESSAVMFSKASGVNQKCGSCHTDVWAAFQKPHHHKLPEGAMSCIDCHNPHGSNQPALLKTAFGPQAGCFRCHTDKRGPFTFEHVVVRTEGCAACHEPHGSANPRMLTRAEVSLQCLECHANIQSPSPSGTVGGVPTAFHDLRSSRYRNCTICHQKIHGSHVNRAFLR